MILIIKNMVCPRCITAVQAIFEKHHYTIQDISLGKVEILEALSTTQKSLLAKDLAAIGFELLDDKRAKLVNEIKSTIIDQIHYQESASPYNFSEILSSQLHHDYAYLSRLFSSVEGRTIEQFTLLQKVEKVKELLTYDELTLSEIAFRLHYSSTAHLSGQFKKMTGMTPTTFKKMQQEQRQFLDEI